MSAAVDVAGLAIQVQSDGVATASNRLRVLRNESSGAQQATDRLSVSYDTLAGYIKKAAAAFGLYKIADYAKEAALMAARYDTMGVSMNIVGNNAGYTAKQMEDFEKALHKNGIAMMETRQVLTQMASAQMDMTKASQLARVAQDAAVIGGINSSEAFQRMIGGIQRGETEILRTIGINIVFEESYKRLAIQLGKNADALSEQEKIQARTNAVLDYGAKMAGTYEAAMGTAGKQLTSMKRYTDNLKVALGSVFNDVLIAAVEATTKSLKDANGQVSEMAEKNQLKKWSEDLLKGLAIVADGVHIVYMALNSLVLTGVAGFQQLYFGTMAFYDALSMDFTGAKQNFDSMLATGEAWVKLNAENWSNVTMFQDQINKTLNDRHNAELQAQAAAKKAADEQKRIQEGNARRAGEQAKKDLEAQQKQLGLDLEAFKASSATKDGIAQKSADLQMTILEGMYAAGKVTTEEYYSAQTQAAEAASQRRLDNLKKELEIEKNLLDVTGKVKGVKSPEYQKELIRNKQLIGEVKQAQTEYDTTVEKGSQTTKQALQADQKAYEDLKITALELAGELVKAEELKQAAYKKSEEYLKRMAGADKEAKEAEKRSDAASLAKKAVEQAQATDDYRRAIQTLQDEIDALNHKDQTRIKDAQTIREGIEKETKLQRDLQVATTSGNTVAIDGLKAQIALQEQINNKIQQNIKATQEETDRLNVLLGLVVGFNNGEAIGKDWYDTHVADKFRKSDSELLHPSGYGNAGMAADPFYNKTVQFTDINGKPIQTLASGSPGVPKDGMYYLHEGEQVKQANTVINDHAGDTYNITIVSQAKNADELARELVPAISKYMRRK